jgi:hypothetical protein
MRAAQPPHTAAWAWTLALTDPYRHRGELMAALPALIEDGRTRPARVTTLATVAWVLDETQTALRLFDEAAQRWRVQGPVPEGLGCAMGVAGFEHGRLDLAYTLGIAAADSSAGAGLPVVAAGADAIVASVLAVRGDLAFSSPSVSRSAESRRKWLTVSAATGPQSGYSVRVSDSRIPCAPCCARLRRASQEAQRRQESKPGRPRTAPEPRPATPPGGPGCRAHQAARPQHT